MRSPGRIGAALAVALATAAGPILAPVPVLAATPRLTIVGAATYEVLPDEGRVAVTVQLTATNHLKDTLTRRFFFRTAYLTVLPGTSGFRISGGTGKPKVSLSASTATYTNLKLDLGANLAAGKSATLTLRFDVRDPGGAPDRPVRISPSLVSFQAWAVATPGTPGGSVVLRFPKGYHVIVGRGPLSGPAGDQAGHDLWSSGSLATPLDFVADVSADRPTDFVATTRTVALSAGPAPVVLQAWPDDAAWRDRVGGLVERSLPVLEREIGVPWPVDGPLAVHEALVRSTGGYAGLFAPAERRIEIAYAAPDGVVLHELAHAWFNGRLVADRWAAEAFASYYAGLAAAELGIDPAPPAPPAEPGLGAIPLNAWGPTGSQDVASETYAYAASLDLAAAIAQRAGPDALRAVWSAAARGIGAYQPDPSAREPAGSVPDWRGLLDLLEDRTGTTFSDLWLAAVARPADVPLLADRAAARGFYARSVALAEAWHLPPEVRVALRGWRFEAARELMAVADSVQAQRMALESSAAAAGLALPDRLRTTFEGAGGLAAAAAEAAAEQATVDAIASAQAARPTEHGIGEQLIQAVGLIAAEPEAQLKSASRALAAGDLETAYGAATSAHAAWLNADQVGRSRIVSTVLLGIALVLLAGLLRGRQARLRRSQA